MSEKQRLKHERDRLARPKPCVIEEDDIVKALEPRSVPRLSWVNLKTRPQHVPNKNRSARRQEQSDALYEAQFREEKANADTRPDLPDNQRESEDMASRAS